jgi:hypothetical protein
MFSKHKLAAAIEGNAFIQAHGFRPNVLDASRRLEAAAATGARERLLDAPRRGRYTRDNMMTFDRQTIDSSGVYLLSQLERFDPTVNAPLVAYTWSRDMPLRSDVTITDDLASWTNMQIHAAGGASPNGKSWISDKTSTPQSVAIDQGKTAQSVNLWGMQAGWTIIELQRAAILGQPLDAQQIEAIQLKWQMDLDEQSYIGDSPLGVKGLVNSTAVAASNVVNGSGGTSAWSTKSADEILADVNTVLNTGWTQTAYAVVADSLLLPPVQYSIAVSRKVSSAGNISLLEYLKANSLSNSINGRPLDIQPLKWLPGRGAAGSDRMVAYARDPKYIRLPVVPLQRTPLEYRDLRQLTTYYGRIGSAEFRYPETLAYADGI